MDEIYNEVFGVTPNKKVDGKAKGNRNERDLCKALTQWTGVEFNRVPSSGGLRWKDGQGITGDVVCDYSHVFPFIVETKFYSNFELKRKLRKGSKINTFWAQAKADCERFNLSAEIKRFPILFARRNGMGKNWAVFVNGEGRTLLRQAGFFVVDGYWLGGSETGWLYGFHSDNLFAVNYTELNQKFLQISK